jgi:phosphohistidine phosphatase
VERRALNLVRHAFAAHDDSARRPDDARRPLTAAGEQRFRRAAHGLRRVVPDVEAVLASGFTRAWQTASILRDEAGWPEAEECPALEAGRAPSSVLAVLRDRMEESLALVGHEPSLSGLASLLCTGDDEALDLRFKTGAVALLSCTGVPVPGAACLRWAVPPKLLRALDGAAR